MITYWNRFLTSKCFQTSPSAPIQLHHPLIMAPEIQPLGSILKSLNWTQFRSQSVFIFKLLSLGCKSTLLYLVILVLNYMAFTPLFKMRPTQFWEQQVLQGDEKKEEKRKKGLLQSILNLFSKDCPDNSPPLWQQHLFQPQSYYCIPRTSPIMPQALTPLKDWTPVPWGFFSR